MLKRSALGLLFILLISVHYITTETITAQPATLFSGPLIAFDSAEQDRVLLYDVATGILRELKFGARWHRVWDFSPDGCRMLLTLSDGMDESRVYTARLDGSDLREVVFYDEMPDDRWSAWNPQWSPDGTRIAFTLLRDEPPGSDEREYHIAWVNANGGTPQLYSASGDEHEPRWSPDGQWLVYMAYEERVAGADYYSTAVPTPEGQTAQDVPTVREADLWVVKADGSDKYRLTSFPTGSVRGAKWSPDGLLVGFVYSPLPGNDQFYMIASAPGGIPTQLSQVWSLIMDITWLPDSTGMLSAVRDIQSVSDNRLWQIPLVGLADQDATLYINDSALNFANYPRFSADGRWLAFRSAYNLALVDTQNLSWSLLAQNLPGNTPPVWSPAGFTGESNCY